MDKSSTKLKALGLAVVAIALSYTYIIAAQSKFKDVPDSHWAMEYINYVYENGIIVGDTSGYFKPDDLLDKFQTSKIIARIAGYKYTDLTASERGYITSAYDKNKSFLNQYDNKFTKWSTNADNEIAYLLEKEIYVPEDLNQFVVVRADGKESLRALSKEEAAVFITKALGKKEVALSTTYDFAFDDDSDMNIAYKPYIYYLKDKGVFTPDNLNKFYPKQGVTRAVLATMLAKALKLGGANEILPSEDIPLGTPEGLDIFTDDTEPDVTKIFSISGVVDKYYEQLNALQIVNSATGKKEIYSLGPDLKIYIDGYIKTIGDLRQGLKFDAVVTNGEIVDIKAFLITSSTTTDPETDVKTSLISGVVKEKSEGSIGIQVNIVTLKGGTVPEIRTYMIDGSCKFMRGGEEITYSDVIIGDIVEASVSTTHVYDLKLYDKNLDLDATLLEKRVDQYTGRPALVVEDQSGNDYTLSVTDSSTLTRKGIGDVDYEGLRVGDKLEIKTEYDKILDLYAVGSRSTIKGDLENLYISRYNSKAAIRSGNKLEEYNIINTVDVYSLRIGSVIEAELDSKEISAVKVISQPSSDRVTANIVSKSNNILNIRDNTDGVWREVLYDNNTVVLDSFTGERVPFSYLSENMQVYIILENPNSSLAKAITILN